MKREPVFLFVDLFKIANQDNKLTIFNLLDKSLYKTENDTVFKLISIKINPYVGSRYVIKLLKVSRPCQLAYLSHYYGCSFVSCLRKKY